MKKVLLGSVCIMAATCSLLVAMAPPSAEVTVIGTWQLKIGSYSDTWTFQSGGIVTSTKQPQLKGTWKQETNCILIQWDEVNKDGSRSWEALTLPEGTKGGNWNGQNVRATKAQ
jgi:hypothetical protein